MEGHISERKKHTHGAWLGFVGPHCRLYQWALFKIL